MPGPPTIALLTDFGLEDTYVGVMKSVILGRCDARIVDLSHSVQAQNIRQAAYLVWTAYKYLPPNTVTVCVVDPGVGTDREAMAVCYPGGYFVGPDNGWLSDVLREAVGDFHGNLSMPVPNGWEAVTLDDPTFCLQPPSSTFHGRDIFSPVAAALAGGAPLEALGRAKEYLAVLPVAVPLQPNGEIAGQIIHIDHFGNLITDITRPMLPATFRLIGGTESIHGPSQTYQEGNGSLITLFGSSDLLEIAAPNGSAARLTGLVIGDSIRIHPER